ncbi:MAG: hypothetical protein GY789_02795 [Hyphomicrobiales bacterium]|nr:hypothetical protein [Hyphomicrobiales bacterium]MCP5001062.1 hypothetical protein [Hyphomicrobiales bacterium]
MSDHDDQSRKAERDLKRVNEEGGLVNTPRLKGKSKSVKGHFMADDVDPSDRIEVWGSRIGRILSLIAVGLLIIWLVDFLKTN